MEGGSRKEGSRRERERERGWRERRIRNKKREGWKKVLRGDWLIAWSPTQCLRIKPTDCSRHLGERQVTQNTAQRYVEIKVTKDHNLCSQIFLVKGKSALSRAFQIPAGRLGQRTGARCWWQELCLKLHSAMAPLFQSCVTMRLTD